MAAFRYIFFACAFTVTSAWTIDLPEARHYYFSKYGKNEDNNNNKVDLKDGEYIYNNIYSNSAYATDSPLYQKPGAYQDDARKPIVIEDKETEVNLKIEDDLPNQYAYETYMEKKIHEIVSNGSRYLEGLSKAIEDFSLQVENCSNVNLTTLMSEGRYSSCEEASRKSEQVRRLSQLALHTARLLQDRAYATDHREEDDSFEDHALLMRLAWFLDRLTELTGFDPKATPVAPALTRPPSTPPPSINLTNLDVPDDVKLSLMNCLQDNSSEPATERCKYPLTLPDQLYKLFNLTENQSGTQLTTQPTNPQAVKTLGPAASPSQLVETSSADKFPPIHELTAVKIVRKRSAPPEKPFEDFIRYYAKHKAWVNVNPVDNRPVMQQEFHDHNELLVKSLNKRSVEYPTPADPAQDIGAYIRSRAQEFLNPDEDQAKKIREFIQNMRFERNVEIKKRSVYSKPQNLIIPEDPQQDLSYYVKNKPGTNKVLNPVQAARLRLGLEQIFQTGNIETIRRFGSNYNPLIPDHNTAGLIRSAADV